MYVIYNARSGILRLCSEAMVLSSLDGNNTNNFVVSINKNGKVEEVESRDLSLMNSAIIIVLSISDDCPDGSVSLEENVEQDAINRYKLLVLDHLRKLKEKNEGVLENKDNVEQVDKRLSCIQERFNYIDDLINIMEWGVCTNKSLLEAKEYQKELVYSDKVRVEDLSITLAKLRVRKQRNNELAQQNRNSGLPEDHQDVIRALIEHVLIEMALCQLSKDSIELSCSTDMMPAELKIMAAKFLQNKL